MEWEPEGRDAWVLDAERWISQIRGVRQSKIDLDSDGEITGVHVVAGMDREPRHIVRDVEGLLKARLGLSVFYKKIGVVQVMDNEGDDPGPVRRPRAARAPVALAEVAKQGSQVAPQTSAAAEDKTGTASPRQDPATAKPAASVSQESGPDLAGTADTFSPETVATDDLASATPLDGEIATSPAVLLAEEISPRLQCSGVGVMASELLVRAEVELQAGAVEARGTEEAPNHSESDMNVIARATVDAVRQLLDEPVLLSLSEVKISSIGGQSVVMVAVELVEGRRSERLVGTCPTSHNRQQAVVYAVLDALNRRLSLMTLKAEEAIN